MPSPQAIAKAVVLTAVSLILINMAKPYMPANVKKLLSA